VLAVLPGLTPARIHLLLAQRNGVANAQPATAGQYVTAQSSKANRITVDMRFDGNRRMRSEAVVLLWSARMLALGALLRPSPQFMVFINLVPRDILRQR
jgi:hypothetical protein